MATRMSALSVWRQMCARRFPSLMGPAHSAGAARVLPDLPIDPRKWMHVLLALIEQNNHRHGVKPKGVSHKTMHDRKVFLISFFRMLRAEGYRMDPRSLGGRHVDHAVKVWIERGLKPATIQTNLSMVRVFATWLGKPASMVKAATHYVPDAAIVRRTYTATEDKSWTGRDVSLDAIRERAYAIDQRAAAALMLMRAFGLRVKEAYMLRPNVAVIEGRMMVIKSDAWTLEDYLAVVRGTKGGRKRMVPVDTDEKRAALEFAKALTRSTQESVGGPTRSLAQVKRRHYYVMELLGVTKGALGITSHGLRHEYASERYQKFADAPSPIRGGAGKKVPGDDRARIRVAQELGHARRSITNAYYGSSANPPQNGGGTGGITRLADARRLEVSDPPAQDGPAQLSQI